MRRALIFVCALGASHASAEQWSVDHADSIIAFEAVAALEERAETILIRSAFERWRATIFFDPEAPSDARLSVEMQLRSLTPAHAAANGEMRGPDWLDVEAHPVARFTAEGFTPLGGGAFVADGVLSLRGKEAPQHINFTLRIEGDEARAVGEAEIATAAFGFGRDVEDRSAHIVGGAVRVSFEITARRL